MSKVRSMRKQLRKITQRAPGTVYGRFDYFLKQLDMRFQTDHLCARPPEMLFLEEMDRQKVQLQALREATAAAIVALDDWVNTYAEELCNEERVKEAHERIKDNGGTLYYVGTVLQQCREALKEDGYDQIFCDSEQRG